MTAYIQKVNVQPGAVFTLVIPVHWRLRQKDYCEFEARLCYIGALDQPGLQSKTLDKKRGSANYMAKSAT